MNKVMGCTPSLQSRWRKEMQTERIPKDVSHLHLHSPSPCTQCKTADATHCCMECKADYCVECKTVHDGFPLLSTHHMVEHGIVVDKLLSCRQHTDKIVEFNCKKCEIPICNSCNTTEHKLHECETTEEALHRILPEIKEHQSQILQDIEIVEERNNKRKEWVADIYSSIESMKKAAKDAHKKQSEKLDQDLASLITELDQMCDRVTPKERVYSDEFLQHVNDSKDVVNWVETTLTTAKGTALLQQLQSGVREQLKKMSQTVHKDRELLQIDDYIKDETITTGLEINHDTNKNTIGRLTHLELGEISSGYWPIQLATLCDKNPKLTQVLSLKLPQADRIGPHFTIIKNELWFVADINSKQCVIKYSTDGKYKSTTNLPAEIKRPRAVVSAKHIHDQTRQVVIAGENGLFVISMDGVIIQTLAKGDFSDVSLSGKTIFALEWDQQRVYSFQFSSGEWKTNNIVQIKYLKGDDVNDALNTIQVYNNHLYIYAMGVEHLHQYTMDGRLVSQCGEEKKGGTGGQFYGGRLCGYDNAGTLIFVDRNNTRLQLQLTADKQWRVINMGSIMPIYAIPLDENSFWVLEG